MNIQKIKNEVRKISYRLAKKISDDGCVFSGGCEIVEILGEYYQIEVNVDCSREVHTYSLTVEGVNNNFRYEDSGNCL